MERNTKLVYNEPDIKVQLGKMLINVLFINYEPPVPSWSFSVHSHSTYELHYIPSGYGFLKVMQQEYSISPGTFYLTGPGVFHEQTADRDNPMIEYCINFEIKHLKKQRRKADTFLENETEQLLKVLEGTKFWFGVDEFNSIELFHNIFQEIDLKLLGYFSSLQNYLSQIIINAARSFSNVKQASYDVPKKILDDSRRAEVDHYFINNRIKPSREELAAKLGLSIRQTERVLLKYFSMNFSQKLNSVRIEHAKALLLDTSLTINQIADKVGYASTNYFSRVFNNIVGISPGEYRNKQKSAASR